MVGNICFGFYRKLIMLWGSLNEELRILGIKHRIVACADPALSMRGIEHARCRGRASP